MTRSAPIIRHQRQPEPQLRSQIDALANEPYVSESFGDFPMVDAAWLPIADPFAGFDQSSQTAHDDPRAMFLALDDDDEVEDDDLFDDDDEDDDLLDDDDEEDDDDFFDDDEDDFDDDEEEDDDDEDDDSYFLGDDDD